MKLQLFKQLTVSLGMITAANAMLDGEFSPELYNSVIKGYYEDKEFQGVNSPVTFFVGITESLYSVSKEHFTNIAEIESKEITDVVAESMELVPDWDEVIKISIPSLFENNKTFSSISPYLELKLNEEEKALLFAQLSVLAALGVRRLTSLVNMTPNDFLHIASMRLEKIANSEKEI